VAAVSAVSSACKPRAQAPAAQPTVVTVAAPIATSVMPYAYATGNVYATESVEVRPRVGGYIDKINFADGGYVEGPVGDRPGQIIFVIDPRPYQARRDSAAADREVKQASLDEAERRLERLEAALAGKAAPELQVIQQRATVLEDRAAVDQAKANLRSAELDLEYAFIRAPIGGRITEREFTVGNLVGAEQVLAKIVKMRPAWVKFDMSEPDYLAVASVYRRPGAIANVAALKVPVDIALANETDYGHSGTIDYVAPGVDPETGTIVARGIFENDDDALQPGFFVRVRVQMAPNPRPAMLVSDRAIGTDQGEKYVLVVGPQNAVEFRSVKTGPIESGLRVIEAGLRPDERIIVDGLQRVRPGLSVEPKVIEMPRSLATTANRETQP
jgi:multidrug efflux system membrane fusion protein